MLLLHYILVNVDDFILTENSFVSLRTFIAHIRQEFAIKDMGKLTYFLGLEVTCTPTDLFLDQAKYAHDILQCAQLEDSKLVSTPLAAGCQLSAEGQRFDDPTLYHSLVGALQYITITQPDLSFAVNLVSQFLHSPTLAHFQAVKRILRNVKHTLAYGLSFTRNASTSLVAYSAADWAHCVETCRFTYGYCLYLRGMVEVFSCKYYYDPTKLSTPRDVNAMSP